MQRGQQEGQNCCRGQHFGGCWRTTGEGGDDQMASGFSAGQEELKGGMGRVRLGTG